ncbi:MAG TPA: hypothetical protein VFK13_11475 [Gemmatimonadaceae bacterium]|nr:hypothetical protein [Gemmatimonadaceae bacterium]
MRTIFRPVWLGLVAVLVGAVAAPAARAQQGYTQTLYWGSGLVDIPVAWASPVTGDLALNFSGMSLNSDFTSDQLNGHGTAMLSLFGRAELGMAFFTRFAQWGAFGRVVLLDADSYTRRSGAPGWLPSVAIGFRNLGPYSHADRFALGYPRRSPRDSADVLHQGFDTSPTIYGVLTKSLRLAELHEGWPHLDVSATLGAGNGLFSDDGGLGDAYSQHSHNGIFGGLRVAGSPARYTTVAVMLEDNSWDYNLGATVDYRGLRAGVYWMGVGASTPNGQPELFDNSRFAFSVGWQTNLLGLVRPDILQRRQEELARQRQELQEQVAQRQQRIAQLEEEIHRLEAQNMLELEQRRAQAEAELRSEREALRRLEERIRQLEQQQRPPKSP